MKVFITYQTTQKITAVRVNGKNKQTNKQTGKASKRKKGRLIGQQQRQRNYLLENSKQKAD